MIDPVPLNLLAQTALVRHVPLAIFIFAFGCILGSFINVVIYRLPEGRSVISPPSRCPSCGARLRWYENFPILGWLWLRGRCRHCKSKISPQYLMVETVTALMILGLYVGLYAVPPSTPWWGEIGGQWWWRNEFFRTWPVFIAIALMLGGLVATTVIDARTFMIPLKIPLVVTFVAFVAYPVAALMPHVNPPAQPWPIPTTDWRWFAAVLGGMAGIGVAGALLHLGRLRPSFADYETYLKEGETLADYPHARREMGVELLFLLPCGIGLAGGWLVGGLLPTAAPPLVVQAIGGTFAGYLVGGSVVWVVRILGTLGFGREAMGLGDVHLLAAIGAVLGWYVPIVVFFLAPFSGLLWFALSKGLMAVFKKAQRELPYGPHLAVATLVVLACPAAINWLLAAIGVPCRI